MQAGVAAWPAPLLVSAAEWATDRLNGKVNSIVRFRAAPISDRPHPPPHPFSAPR